jgi:hypothetical protein
LLGGPPSLCFTPIEDPQIFLPADRGEAEGRMEGYRVWLEPVAIALGIGLLIGLERE